MSTVIKVENLSKQYRLGTVGTGTLSHDINRWWQLARGKEDPYLKIGEINDRTQKGNSDYVWALRDINFEVQHGEVLGIIGRNGAGKSTLLKILSRTTAPSTGCVKIKGRVASLLEVGTGFHPELSGRDNIFLNGAILGMTRNEIKSKFDEIVDFAGVERYIDTPVKRYSSGMYVRLAFAVAAHLEPEILIIDEVLAVGDAEFQKKCLGKMRDVSEREGRTVLFVSHNMEAIQNLCKRSVLMARGGLLADGNTSKIVSTYLKRESSDDEVITSENGEFNLLKNKSKIYSSRYGLTRVRLFNNEVPTIAFFSGAHCKILIDFEEERPISDLVIGIVIKNENNKPIMAFNNRHYAKKLFTVPITKGSFCIEIAKFPIYGEGKYFCDLYLGNVQYDYDIIYNAFYFELNSSDPLFSGCKLDPALNQFYFETINFTDQ
ncbi:lipopolysaccharide transport system ATP-binding protein [Algoriphagus boseongensis]|uniref:Lipopolysaccharide transport system ATP-binding protein n=1 Tax=Algoriphagus boseongensis TaxID=1442587 RepID=A0A4R6TD52_9BACT|nr:ABC transporter ATP-binding protein [Algoriphagus boseongensis]TDQ19384.1 lipopolysaccharide transport system ATP-binding protein [Algoriphagus boseongensis]